MMLSDKLYNILKWACLVCIPACTTCYVTVAAAVGLPYAEEIAKISAAVCTLIGALIGVSTASYNNKQ